MPRFPFIDAGRIRLRPAHADDQAGIQDLVTGLSSRARYLRFFNGVRELTPAWLERFTRADPRGDLSVLATMSGNVVGMAQYSADPYPARADFAVVVSDRWQGMGIGTALIAHLLGAARGAGIEEVHAEVLTENNVMLRLLQAAGFRIRRDPETALVLHAHFNCNAAVAA